MPDMEDVAERYVDYRFLLANERTFLAWIRTALGIVAGGVALDQFVVVEGEQGMVAQLAIVTIFLGAVIAVVGTLRWSRADRVMREGLPMVEAFPWEGAPVEAPEEVAPEAAPSGEPAAEGEGKVLTLQEMMEKARQQREAEDAAAQPPAEEAAPPPAEGAAPPPSP